MSKILIIEDSLARPDLFHWNGPIDQNKLNEWLQYNTSNILPNDLIELWRLTGGGDFFETETILSPFGNKELVDDIKGFNDYLLKKIDSKKYLIFHTGIITTAIDLLINNYVTLNTDSYKIINSFANLNAWYTEGIRNELGNRYGLSE
jgi:hypothetical protein